MTIKHSFKKIIIYSACIFLLTALIILISVFFVNGHVENSVKENIVSANDIPESQYDCILVLGCGVYSDGAPTPMLEDRLRRAVELYNAGASSKIIMSGDHGQKNYDEVNTMREYAINNGVPAEDIFMDHAGFSTYESMYRAKEIFCAKNILVVTQKYHLYRALYITKQLKMTAIGIAADYRRYYGQTYRDLREVAARYKDFFKCIFKPEPTFLGKVIPVSGNGTVTVD